MTQLKQHLKTKKGNQKKHKLGIKLAFNWFIWYVKTYKVAFFYSFLAAVVATFIQISIIIGIGDLTTAVNNIITATNRNNYLLSLIILGVSLIVAYLINAFFFWLAGFVSAQLSQKIGYQIRLDLFHKIQTLSMYYFDTNKSGNIMSVLINDVYTFVLYLANNMVYILYGLLTMLGTFILMFIISPYISLIVFSWVFLVSMGISAILKISAPAFLTYLNELGNMNAYIEETISGQSIINYFSHQKWALFSFHKINKKLVKSATKAQTIAGILIPWLILLNNTSIAITLMISGVFAAKNIDFGSSVTHVSWLYLFDPKTVDFNQFRALLAQKLATIPKGSNIETIVLNFLTKVSLISALLFSIRNFTQPINQMVASASFFQAAVAGIKRIDLLAKQKSENKVDETISLNHPLKGAVTIKNLNFAYVKNKLVLKNINLNVKPGESVAIVGPTGSGKTTIINLLTKFYDIEDGQIYLDDYNIKTLKKDSLRKQISIVVQDSYLFAESIIDNFRNAKQNATDEEIYEIAKKAHCDDFIQKLEHGYNTVLSENGSQLSKGQKQLIAIAMAMLSDSSVIIFDEATSNVDSQTEQLVQKAVAQLFAQKTSFIIAHRLSTVRKADKIVVLKNGEIIEVGSHKELLNKKGFYYNLVVSKVDDLDIES